MVKFQANLMFGRDGEEKTYTVDLESSMASDSEIKRAAYKMAQQQDPNLVKEYYLEEVRLTFFKRIKL